MQRTFHRTARSTTPTARTEVNHPRISPQAAATMAQGLLQMQRGAGNRAVLQYLQTRLTGAPVPVQRKPVAQLVRMGSNTAMYEEMIDVAIEAGPSQAIYTRLYQLYQTIDADADVGTFQASYNAIMGVNHHPSGYAYGNGTLYPQYYNVRGSFFPNHYSAAAIQNKNQVVANNPGSDANHWTCPCCNGDRDLRTYAGEPTIDHRLDCATYWNQSGHDESRQDRINFYSDITNHDIVCRSCNSSMGGANYQRRVGPNFTH